jgi:hypothetical protein
MPGNRSISALLEKASSMVRDSAAIAPMVMTRRIGVLKNSFAAGFICARILPAGGGLSSAGRSEVIDHGGHRVHGDTKNPAWVLAHAGITYEPTYESAAAS